MSIYLNNIHGHNVTLFNTPSAPPTPTTINTITLVQFQSVNGATTSTEWYAEYGMGSIEQGSGPFVGPPVKYGPLPFVYDPTANGPDSSTPLPESAWSFQVFDSQTDTTTSLCVLYITVTTTGTTPTGVSGSSDLGQYSVSGSIVGTTAHVYITNTNTSGTPTSNVNAVTVNVGSASFVINVVDFNV